MIELYAEHGGLDKAKAVRFLRDKFLAYAQDDSIGPEEKDQSILAIGELIEQLGGKPSASPVKLFSTPSDGKEEPSGSRGPLGRGPPAARPVPAEGITEADRLRAKLAAAELELEGLRQEKAESEAGKGRDCPFSHDKELRKKELEKKGSGKGSDGSYPARNAGPRSESRGRDKKKGQGRDKKKGQGKGRDASRGASPKDRRPDKSQKPCPFFLKKGACKKGSACDMSHSLPVTNTGTASTSGGVPPGWSAPSGGGLANPFHAFTVVAVKEPAAAASVFAAAARPDGVEAKKGCFTDLDRLPKDWWQVGKKVETLLDGGAGSNHVTEELVVSILNHAANLGIKPNSPEFPIVRFEQWVYPEYVHGIASGSPVPLKGAVVLKVRLQEGPDENNCKDGHEIYVMRSMSAAR
eukprot:s612_g23.t1